MVRFVVLDTETTGFTRERGFAICYDHRVIEVACVEIEDGVRTGVVFHAYVNPGRDVDPGAARVHGITNAFLRNKLQFKDVAGDLVRFIGKSIVVMHNAPFDIAFLNQEFGLLDEQPVQEFRFIDTLALARSRFPGFRNDLNSLCLAVGLDGRGRHGALVDAELLAMVFLVLFSSGYT